MATSQYSTWYERAAEDAQLGRQKMMQDAARAKEARQKYSEYASQFETSSEAAQRYPEVERVAREVKSLQQMRNYLISNGLPLNEANEVSLEMLKTEKQANLDAVRNQILTKKLEMQTASRNLQAQNYYIQAQTELANIPYTDRNALNKISAIRSKYSPLLAGTENESTWAKSIASLESGVSNYQTAQHYQNLDDPTKQALIVTARTVAEQEAKAPLVSAEQKEKREAAIERAILQYSVKNDVSVGEATEALYPTAEKPIVPAGQPKTGATTPSMPSNVVTKIPQGSGLEISGGLGTPMMGAGNIPIPKQGSSQIIAPIDEAEEATPVIPPISQPKPLPSSTPQATTDASPAPMPLGDIFK